MSTLRAMKSASVSVSTAEHSAILEAAMKAKLTPQEIAFLESQGLGAEDMFDGSNMSQRDREAAMEALGKRFYFGGKPCGAALHTLRAKAGHCIQCDTSKIAFSTRHSSPARLYVAGSLRGQRTKIGSAGSIDERLVRLRSEPYGGFDDWEMLAATPTLANAGKIEASAQRALRDFQQPAIYTKAGVAQLAREMFACSFPVAAKALIDALPDPQEFELLCNLQQAKRYEWQRAA